MKTARELGAKALRIAAEGRDVADEKKQARAAKSDSVEFIVERFIERHIKRNYRPRPLREAERLLRVHVVASWRGRAFGSITRADVRAMLDKIVDDAPIMANQSTASPESYSIGLSKTRSLRPPPSPGLSRPPRKLPATAY